jgi:glutaredoxin
MLDRTEKKAVLYRMVMDKHVCPYGIKSKWLLDRHGFEVEDRQLTTREETDAFKNEHSVSTTPQVFIQDERVGGYEDIRAKLTAYEKDSEKTSYTPVFMIFAISALMALAVSHAFIGSVATIRTVELFAAFAMSVLAIQKLQDVEQFSTMFLNYDLLAKRHVSYGYVYPFAEGAAGVMMIAGGTLGVISSPIALFIGTIGAISVYKAVYIDKRDIKCACVGGNSRVPLGFVSLTENLVMMAMGIWMPIKMFIGS